MKGRISVGRTIVVEIVIAVWLLALVPGTYVETYLVGGSTQQWKFASSGYSYDANWTPQQTFYFNDVLEFNYTMNRHNVVELGSKAKYDACSGTPLQTWQSGDDLVTLNSVGTKYYICGLPGHCQVGMKVSITVVDDIVVLNIAPASSPTTTPVGAPTSSPTTTPVDVPTIVPLLPSPTVSTPSSVISNLGQKLCL